MNLRYLLIFFLQSHPGRGKFLLPNTQASFQSLCLSFPFRFLVSHHNVNLLHQLLQLSLTGSQEPTTGKESLKLQSRHTQRRPSVPSQQSQQNKLTCTKGPTLHLQCSDLCEISWQRNTFNTCFNPIFQCSTSHAMFISLGRDLNLVMANKEYL